MIFDSLGNPVTLREAASLEAVNDFVEGFIACEARVVRVLDIADTDDSPLVQACCAALHLFAESNQAAAHAAPFVARARAGLADRAISARERRLVAAIAAWAEGDLPRAMALHEEQAREFPRDLASIKLGQYHLFNAGNSPGMLRLALHGLGACAEVPYMHGMAAFAWEQCHLLPQAEAAARQAIALRHKEPWAHHALAHVMLTQGRLQEGLDFMRAMSPSWTGLNSFMLTHNWWHTALFALEFDRPDEVLALYDQQVWGVARDYSQDQIGAVSLLARLELAGVDVGPRWQDVADHLVQRGVDLVQPFLSLQYLYGLARAGRPQADTLLAGIEAHAHQPESGAVWRGVALPAARGLLAHARGDHALAVRQLGSALPRMLEVGGSHAQRDLFEQIHLDALMRSGHTVGAQHLLQQRANAQPESLRLARQAREVRRSLGLCS
ncbi:MAG: tetratricopeptide repeat protein [Rhodoferax sp.]|nr:tetratricopeptide repeat protein [Rhodoferax sp.]